MSPAPARRIEVKGEVSSRSDADDLLEAPGDVVFVNRGRPRSIVIACPDGCGSVLTVNLDPQAGPAWRVYPDRTGVSVYPSVWKEGGCRSHFIIWSGRIIWCDRYLDGNREPAHDKGMEERVLSVLSRQTWSSGKDIADRLDEIPWEVSSAARQLVRHGLAETGEGRLVDHYRKLSVPARPGKGRVAGDKDGFWSKVRRWLRS